MTDEFTRPLSGNRLIEFFEQYSSILFPNLVSQSPELATQRAEKYFGTELTQAATNIPSLAEIRNHIYECSPEIRVIDSFTIVLPHTHWKKRTPIIYSFDKPNKRYIIGPHQIIERETYIPVSFAFYKGTAIPYEWADETVGIDLKEFDTCLEIIQKVASKYDCIYFPFGISIDFRFKATLFSTFGGTVEIPETDENSPLAEFSYIIAQTAFDRSDMNLSLAQVAWHPHSDKILNLNEEETDLLTELRKLLSNANSDIERNQILTEIGNHLNR